MPFQDNSPTAGINVKYSMDKSSAPVGIDLVMSVSADKMFYL
jgi:hypothetical protein